MLIHDKFCCKGNDNYGKFYNIIKRLSKRQSVEFALYCAKDVFHLVEDRYKKSAKLCIDLVEKWLNDESSVTNTELSNAAAAAWAAYAADAYAYAARAAAYVAYAVYLSSAAYAAYATSVADTAIDTSAAYAAFTISAADTAVDTADAGYGSKSNELNEYLIIVNSYLTKTNINCPNYEIEGKILYLIDELEENIIVHKDKYYVNMNGIENCPEYGFSSQEELLEKLLYSEDRFWEFTRNWLDNLYKESDNVNS